MFKFLIVPLIILAFSLKIVNSTSIRRFYFNSILYEDYSPESKSVMFIRTADKDWMNLAGLAKKSRLKFKSVFCTIGKGAWIVYPEKNYEFGINTNFHIVIGEECIAADDAESVQPLGAMNRKLASGLFTFTKPYFASKSKVVTGSTSGAIKSLFQFGQQNWTIQGDGKNGKAKFCIKRSIGDDGTSYCAFSNIETQLGISGSLTIKEGCDVKDRVFEFETCYSGGSHKISIEKDITFSNVKGLCKSSMNSTEKNLLNKFSQIMEIWDARMHGKMGGESAAKLKLAPEEADIKAQILWKILSVFHSGCPSVSAGYLSILGNIFYKHLELAWKNAPESQLLDGDRWPDAESYLEDCSVSLVETGEIVQEPLEKEILHPAPPEEPDFVFQDISEKDKIDLTPTGRRVNKRSVETISLGTTCRTDSLGIMDPEDHIGVVQYMIDGQHYDKTIEQVWMIFNFVNPYCSFVSHYTDNSWAYFVSILRNAYLNPVQNQWIKPGIWAQMYPNMFNGYDMEIEKGKIISCVQSTVKRTSHFDPISRPKIFDKFRPSNATSKSSGKGLTKESKPEVEEESETASVVPETEEGSKPVQKGRGIYLARARGKRRRGRIHGGGGKKKHRKRRRKHNGTANARTANQLNTNLTDLDLMSSTTEIPTLGAIVTNLTHLPLVAESEPSSTEKPLDGTTMTIGR